MRREFKNWAAPVRMLLWLRHHPHCAEFNLDTITFNTRCYTGRQS